MVLTVQQLLTEALALIGAVAMDETPSDSELNVALRTANIMIDRWSSQRLMLRSSDTLTVPLTAGKDVYTVALSGADVASSKPLAIQSAYIRDNANVDYPLDIVDKSVYDALQDKEVSSGRPNMLVYDPGTTQQSVQTGSFYFYYTPDQSYTAYIDCTRYLTEFVNQSDNVSFEPAYYEALIYNLAIRLFRLFHAANVPIPQDIVGVANGALNNIQTMNAVQPIAASDFPVKGGKYNIYTDQG